MSGTRGVSEREREKEGEREGTDREDPDERNNTLAFLKGKLSLLNTLDLLLLFGVYRRSELGERREERREKSQLTQALSNAVILLEYCFCSVRLRNSLPSSLP